MGEWREHLELRLETEQTGRRQEGRAEAQEGRVLTISV